MDDAVNRTGDLIASFCQRWHVHNAPMIEALGELVIASTELGVQAIVRTMEKGEHDTEY